MSPSSVSHPNPLRTAPATRSLIFASHKQGWGTQKSDSGFLPWGISSEIPDISPEMFFQKGNSLFPVFTALLWIGVPVQDLSEKGSVLAGSPSPWDKPASTEAAETAVPKAGHAVSRKAKIWPGAEMPPDSQAPKRAEGRGYNLGDILAPLVDAGTGDSLPVAGDLLQPSSGSPASQSLLLEVAVLRQFPWKPETDG